MSAKAGHETEQPAMTLSTRLKRLFIVYAACVFAVFTGLTVISLFILEDGFFDRTLKTQARHLYQSSQLPTSPVAVAPHIRYYPDQKDSPFNEYTFNENDKYEVTLGNQYYHVLTLENRDEKQGLLAFNVTSQLLVNRSADDLAFIFVPVLIVLLIVTYFLARFFVKITLSPFHQLVSAVAKGNNHEELLILASQLHEQDIKDLLLTLADSWHQKEVLLQEKIAFNQGISHELRTPMQVAKHAAELVLHERDVAERAQVRLTSALHKMEKISQAFLWLSSENVWTKPVSIGPILQSVVEQLDMVAQKRGCAIRLNIVGDFTITAPDEVLQVLIENLLLNSLNHGVGEEVVVQCDNEKLQISNQIPATSQHEGFGIGLLLIKNIAERFDIRWEKVTENNRFVFTLYADIPN